MAIWNDFYSGSRSSFISSSKPSFKYFEDAIIVFSEINNANQKAGGEATRNKAEVNKRKILDKANSIDPEKKMSAYQLTQEIGPEYATYRTVKNKLGHSTKTTKRKTGFGDSTIRKVLKENGWKQATSKAQPLYMKPMQ